MKRYEILLCTLPFVVSAETFQDYPEVQYYKSGTYQSVEEKNEFDQWRKQQQQEFGKYREEQQREYEVYVRTLEEEFSNYRRSIQRVWDKVEVSRPKSWVEYSSDRKIKRVVDYDKNEIRIHVIEQKGKDAARVMEDALKDMLSEPVATAVQREPVMSKLDQRLPDRSPVVKKGNPGDQLVLNELFDRPRPTREDVALKARTLLKGANISQEIAKSGTKARPKEAIAMVVRIPLPKDRPLRKAAQYRAMVRKHAEKWKINESLILAVIHTESAFNPMATSYVPAYGMMQIVPKYAGKEVAEMLWGKPTLLAPSYLYNADNNIMIGSVYLNLLYYQYFQGVKDPESRLFCAISAYNTGPGNVARAFTGKRNLSKAITRINDMTAQQVYERLRTHLPFKETRDYIQKVSKRMKVYQDL